MTTIIFDFDSTLINCESLAKILERKLANNIELQEKIEKITTDGLNGKITFGESLRKRLAIASLTKKEAIRFGKEAIEHLSAGASPLIKFLQDRRCEIWVISGSLKEIITPACLKLGLKKEHIRGIQLLWSDEGDFLSVDEFDPFSHSKVEGVKEIGKAWTKPTILIGDSMSDYLLYEKGFVDHFILYSEHFVCEPVISKGVQQAKNMLETKKIISGLLDA